MTKRIPETAWASELLRFTSRNAGRATKLELDSPSFESAGRGQELRGIAYDARDEQILITLGMQGRAQETHSVKDADAIYVLIDTRGRDEALAIAHNHTQTLIRFLDLS